MHLYACCVWPMADSREASRRRGALKARPLRPRDAYRRLLTGVFHGPRTPVNARTRVARAFRRARMQCWAVLCAVLRRVSDAPIGVEI